MADVPGAKGLSLQLDMETFPTFEALGTSAVKYRGGAIDVSYQKQQHNICT